MLIPPKANSATFCLTNAGKPFNPTPKMSAVRLQILLKFSARKTSLITPVNYTI